MPRRPLYLSPGALAARKEAQREQRRIQQHTRRASQRAEAPVATLPPGTPSTAGLAPPTTPPTQHLGRVSSDEVASTPVPQVSPALLAALAPTHPPAVQLALRPAASAPAAPAASASAPTPPLTPGASSPAIRTGSPAADSALQSCSPERPPRPALPATSAGAQDAQRGTRISTVTQDSSEIGLGQEWVVQEGDWTSELSWDDEAIIGGSYTSSATISGAGSGRASSRRPWSGRQASAAVDPDDCRSTDGSRLSSDSEDRDTEAEEELRENQDLEEDEGDEGGEDNEAEEEEEEDDDDDDNAAFTEATPYSLKCLRDALGLRGCACAPPVEQGTPLHRFVRRPEAGTDLESARSDSGEDDDDPPGHSAVVPNVLQFVQRHHVLPKYSEQQLHGTDWRALLGGRPAGRPDTERTALSLERSCLSRRQVPFTVQRTWDIDALLLPLRSLAAHRHGLELIYHPRYQKTIVADWHTPVGRSHIRPRHCKHLRFARGVGATGFDTFIFFPGLDVQRTRGNRARDARRRCYLTRREQAHFVDTILLPSVRATYGDNILHHHPRSFAEAYDRSYARQKSAIGAADRSFTELAYKLPNYDDTSGDLAAPALQRLWDDIQQRFRRDPDPRWRVAELVTITYDCKLLLQSATLARLRERVDALLDDRFDRSYIDLRRAFVDLAFEDVPSRQGALYGAEPLVALRKTSCNLTQASKLGVDNPRVYQWCGTADASSVTAHPSTGSAARTGGIAYVQSYNVIKDLLASPSRTTDPLFSQPLFRSLAFPQRTLDESVPLGHADTRGKRPPQRRRILQVLKAEITQVHNSLAASQRSPHNIGVRQEFRVCWDLFQRLTVPADQPTVRRTARRRAHWPFFVFRKADVLAFLRLQVNRWLYALSAVLSTPSWQRSEQLDQDSKLEQHSASAMLAVLLDVLALVANSNSVDRHQRYARAWYRLPETAGGAMRRGLGLADTLRQTNLPWLPLDAFDFLRLRWLPDVVQHTAYSSDILQQLLRTSALGRLEEAFRAEVDRSVGLVRTAIAAYTASELQRDYDDIFEQLRTACRTFHELCLFRYAYTILRALGRRNKRLAHARLPFLASSPGISGKERVGLHGISYSLAHRSTGGPPSVITVRSGGGRGSATGFSAFPSNWRTRLQLLFDWNDGFERQAWAERPWRRWTRYCYRRLRQLPDPDASDPNWGARAARRWRRAFGAIGERYLTIIPAYDNTKLTQVARFGPEADRGTLVDPSTGETVVPVHYVKWTAAFPAQQPPARGPGRAVRWELVKVQPATRRYYRKLWSSAGLAQLYRTQPRRVDGRPFTFLPERIVQIVLESASEARSDHSESEAGGG